MKKDITFKFGDDQAADHFALWFCESGEQSYWDWMQERERETLGEGDITAVRFEYYPEQPCDDDSFVADGVIRTKLGRLIDDD